MWNEILGTLAIVAMVYLCANASEVIAAVCDRIRYGVQAITDDTEPVPDSMATAVADKPAAATKPVTAKAA